MRFLDTNIILRYLTRDDPIKARACLALFQQVKAGQEQLYTTDSVIAEVVYVLSSKRQQYQKSRLEIVALLAPVLRLRHVRLPRKRVVIRALILYLHYSQFDFEDALSVAAMEQIGLSEIFSYDTDFDNVPNIVRREP